MVSVKADCLNHISVFNLMGQVVMQQVVNANHATIDLSALPKGTYFVKAISDNGSLTQKIVKIQ